ncbi:hypothetical protein Pla100_32120 [Neorhodopirellula pilleata]|uniref:Uncharacterized protein n=1 Tax=Neorhodopirellula pilleata TaxID=2714738 RepID=A0A5C6A963_9BACT|nr:hypothetical protein Pla100_32120 [Neorhodopirellula pilleata]
MRVAVWSNRKTTRISRICICPRDIRTATTTVMVIDTGTTTAMVTMGTLIQATRQPVNHHRPVSHLRPVNHHRLRSCRRPSIMTPTLSMLLSRTILWGEPLTFCKRVSQALACLLNSPLIVTIDSGCIARIRCRIGQRGFRSIFLSLRYGYSALASPNLCVLNARLLLR